MMMMMMMMMTPLLIIIINRPRLYISFLLSAVTMLGLKYDDEVSINRSIILIID